METFVRVIEEQIMVKDTGYFAIQTVGLTKVFRDFWGHARVRAVDDLNLEIQGREVYGLLGPNGSGKSTTIKMLLGLLFPSRGVAQVLGRPPGDVKTNHRIGYLPEESYLYPFLTARETLDFYGRLFELPRAERQRRIDSLLDMVGLQGVLRRPLGEYSKGMMRRIGLAQALINDPDLLILDEPTSGLDPIGTRQIKDLIAELGRRGKTVLLCSHLLADVEDVCDRIGILYGGKLREEGRVRELLAQKQQTQIRSGRLSEGAIQKIEKIILSEYPDGAVEVETPRERLEDHFLRIVSKAQEEMETSGALMGGKVSDFLGAGEGGRTAEEGETVIEGLLAGREHAVEAGRAKGASETASVPAEETGRVLDSLLTGGVTAVPVSHEETKSAEWAASTTPVSPAKEEAEVDRSVIEHLLGGSKQESQDGAPGGERQHPGHRNGKE